MCEGAGEQHWHHWQDCLCLCDQREIPECEIHFDRGRPGQWHCESLGERSGKAAKDARDQLIRLDYVEVRKIHRKASGEIPEGAVHPDLALMELSANFGSGAGAKRKRGNQWLG